MQFVVQKRGDGLLISILQLGGDRLDAKVVSLGLL
jgi:hypothetical protein